MKVVHINTLERGGASFACFRLHQALLNEGVDSKVLLLLKRNQLIDASIPEVYAFQESTWWNKGGWGVRIMREIARRNQVYQLKGKIDNTRLFHAPTSSFDILDDQWVKQADIINLHWVCQLLDYPSFFSKVNKPVFWTLHDMAPFTGGCDYSMGCEQFKTDCEKCGFLEGARNQRFAEKGLRIKQKALEKGNPDLHIVTLSQWLKEQARSSKLFQPYSHYLIPNSLDVDVFAPQDQVAAKQALGLPAEKQCLLFLADSIDDKRKGLGYLLEAIQLLPKEKYHVFAVGEMADSSLDIQSLGYISSKEKLAQAYAAADAFVIPSVQDNLPNTVLEAMACGTPVIGFPIGGIPDMVKEGETGVLAKEVSAESLATAILKKESYQFDVDEIRESALLNYSPSVQAKKYMLAYQDSLRKK